MVKHGFIIRLIPTGYARRWAEVGEARHTKFTITAEIGGRVCWVTTAVGLFDAERQICDEGFYLNSAIPVPQIGRDKEYVTVGACRIVK